MKTGAASAIWMVALFLICFECAADAAMNECPLNKSEMEGGVQCPKLGEELRHVAVDAPQRFYLCSICHECWSGIVVEAGKDYRIQIIGEPQSWGDGAWKAATAEEALKGWSSLSDIPDTKWWQYPVVGPFVWWAKRSRRVPESDWFQIFFAVRDATGTDSEPIRLQTVEQVFSSPASGELYLFANDHPAYYEKNNTGRMLLEISLENRP